MNSVILIGNLAADPEVRYTKTGKAVASFRVAVNRYEQSKTDGKTIADYIPVVAWNDLAEMCGNNLGKGSKVCVHGRLQVRSYDGQGGQKRWITEVVADLVSPNFESDKRRATAPKADAAKAFGGRDVFPPEEELPF